MIQWHDLLARSFDQSNCWQLAAEVCARAGLMLPALPEDWASAEREVAPVLAYVGATPSCAREIGDIIASDPEKLGYTSHVAVVVEPGFALSTSKEKGAYCFKVARHAHDRGVWRPMFMADGRTRA